MFAGQPARILLAHTSISGRPAAAAAVHDSFPSPLERNPQASKGWKKREADGVGLAIVAALNKSGPISHRPSKIAVAEQKSSPPKSAAEDFPVADFLSSCNLCGKTLHGKDIYMYRGEKAFCSMECRYKQIVSDECLEKCVSGVLIRQPEIPSAPCSGDRRLLFSAGIMAL
ncbi:hypothetical protein KSP40_PGU010825 [Platanthera guangdongensis]|uniref:FLZ-type domain-containing protein n=1 Tax=Platanthera guangdongensis TaxID=2320717 RepID=A0ABR2LHI2_9ASPA